MKKSAYMQLDICILTVITCLLEAVNIFAVRRIFPESVFSVSILLPMAVIVMVRWRAGAVVTVLAAGLVSCVCSGADAKVYFIYCIGSLFALVTLFWFFIKPLKKFDGKTVWLTLAYLATAYIFISLGRAAAAAITGANFFNQFWIFLMSETLNLVMGTVILAVASRQKGMLEYQPDYLKRIAEERRKAALASNATDSDNIQI